jgi:hypothetical protein
VSGGSWIRRSPVEPGLGFAPRWRPALEAEDEVKATAAVPDLRPLLNRACTGGRARTADDQPYEGCARPAELHRWGKRKVEVSNPKPARADPDAFEVPAAFGLSIFSRPFGHLRYRPKNQQRHLGWR